MPVGSGMSAWLCPVDKLGSPKLPEHSSRLFFRIASFCAGTEFPAWTPSYTRIQISHTQFAKTAAITTYRTMWPARSEIASQRSRGRRKARTVAA